jgi:pantoate--beta-alanine ligase
MIIFRKKDELNAKISSLKEENTTVGFVPTMGALHQGHLSLVEEALANNNLVVVSIFVNPTQFDNSEDLKKYPRNLQQDVDLLNTLSDKIIVYAPTVEDIYEGETKSRKFNFDGLEHQMEGKFRDGHFDGVGTIVKLLFDIVKPNNAYFGEKDFQQLAIIKKLVSKYNMPVNIVGCKIKRDANGLALSSRNTRLKPEHKVVAPFIYKTLKAAKEKFGTKSANKVIEWVVNQFANHELLELEYFTIADEATLKTVKRKSKNKQYRAFIAVYAGKIRLIDNIALN